MTGEVWRRDAVESPCINVCVLHPDSGLCIGCYRTGTEIAAWSGMTREARRALMADLPSRAALIRGTRKGGRAGRREREE